MPLKEKNPIQCLPLRAKIQALLWTLQSLWVSLKPADQKGLSFSIMKSSPFKCRWETWQMTQPEFGPTWYLLSCPNFTCFGFSSHSRHYYKKLILIVMKICFWTYMFFKTYLFWRYVSKPMIPIKHSKAICCNDWLHLSCVAAVPLIRLTCKLEYFRR